MDIYQAIGTTPHQHYKDVSFLTMFVSETGMIMHRRKTNLPRKKQRETSRMIRRARAMGLMPYTYRLE